MLKPAMLGLLFLTACSGDNTTPPPTGATPSAPANVLTNARTGEIVVSWQDGSNETSYRVEYRTEAAPNWQLLLLVPANTTQLVHPNVVRGVQYFYRVAACNDVGCSGWSEAGGKWQSGGPPSLLSSNVTGIGGNVATLSAQALSGGVPVNFVFAVTRAADNALIYTSEPVRVIPTDPENLESIVTGFANVTLLQPSTDYRLSVTATNELGASPPIAARAFRTATIGPPSFSSQANGTAGGQPAFIIHVHANGFDTEYSFQLARAGQSFETPLATESAYAAANSSDWLAFTTSMPKLAQPGLTYKWRVVAKSSAGTAASDTLQFTRP